MDCGPAGGAARRAVFPRRVHRADGDRGYRVPEPDSGLRYPVPGSVGDAVHHRRRSRTSGWRDRLPRRTTHVGTKFVTEPSLVIPGIIISCIFNEQGKLIFRVITLQNQFTNAVEAIDDPENGRGVQITAANFPRCARSYLFAL